MLEKIPSLDEIQKLLGENAFGAWVTVAQIIKSHYETDEFWDKGGKNWDYEYKFRISGKTLCAMYAKKEQACIMIIFGKNERAKFEAARAGFSAQARKLYDGATTYHDGKWVMFPLDYGLPAGELISPVELEQLLFIKKKPNKNLMPDAAKYSLKDIMSGNIITNDMLYSYARKTEIKDKTFKFSFEFDLTKEIKDADLADMIMYCCQRDIRMQKIILENPINDAFSICDIIAIAEKYRKILLET